MYVLNLHNVMCQLYLNKAGDERELACLWKWKKKKRCSVREIKERRASNLSNRTDKVLYWLSGQWRFKHVCNVRKNPIEITYLTCKSKVLQERVYEQKRKDGLWKWKRVNYVNTKIFWRVLRLRKFTHERLHTSEETASFIGHIVLMIWRSRDGRIENWYL